MPEQYDWTEHVTEFRARVYITYEVPEEATEEEEEEEEEGQ